MNSGLYSDSDDNRFESPLYVGRPNIGDRKRFIERIDTMLDNRWLSNNGPMVTEFEQRLSDYCGVSHCIAICNATVAMEIVARALDVTGEVLVPAYTFVATAHAFRWQEIKPIFVDMDPTTHNIDVSRIEASITPKTTAIVGTHVWGRPCDIDAISMIADKYQLKVIYDAAHAFGCSYKGKMLGGHGNCELFSFHATKFLNSFEGGAIATNDGELADRLRLMRNFGFQGFDKVVHLGTNGKMSEIHAAMGLTCLESIEQIIKINLRNYECYCRYLSNVPGVSIIEYDKAEHNNYQYVVLEIDPEIFPVSRDRLVEYLISKNVIARKYFWPGVHRMEPYKTEQPNAWMSLGETERIASRVIVLPTGQTIDCPIIERISDLIRNL